MKLQDAADFLTTGNAPKQLIAMLRSIRSIFTFQYERSNRLARFISVTKAYNANVPVNDIISKYGCSKHTVLRYARLANLPKRPKTDDPERRARIIALSKSKPQPSQKSIAKTCKCSVALVSVIEHEAGLNRYG